jgi:hypothetical protein
VVGAPDSLQQEAAEELPVSLASGFPQLPVLALFELLEEAQLGMLPVVVVLAALEPPDPLLPPWPGPDRLRPMSPLRS